jgi:hypothetical protein
VVDSLELGVGSALDLIFWASMIWFGTLVLELFVVFWCRGLFKRAGKPTGRLLLLLVLMLCVVVPLVGGYAGCAASVQRSSADAIDEVNPAKVIEWTIDRGASEARAQLGITKDAKVVEIEKLRETARARARIGGDLGDLLEGAWWWAVDATLAKTIPPAVGWDWIIEQVTQQLKAKVREVLGDHAEAMRSGSRKTLYYFLAFLLLVNGLTVFFVRRAARLPRPQPVAPSA